MATASKRAAGTATTPARTESVLVTIHFDRGGHIAYMTLPDESQETIPVASFGTRGAMREVTAWMIANGWQPVERLWDTDDYNESQELGEVHRTFKR